MPTTVVSDITQDYNRLVEEQALVTAKIESLRDRIAGILAEVPNLERIRRRYLNGGGRTSSKGIVTLSELDPATGKLIYKMALPGASVESGNHIELARWYAQRSSKLVEVYQAKYPESACTAGEVIAAKAIRKAEDNILQANQSLSRTQRELERIRVTAKIEGITLPKQEKFQSTKEDKKVLDPLVTKRKGNEDQAAAEQFVKGKRGSPPDRDVAKFKEVILECQGANIADLGGLVRRLDGHPKLRDYLTKTFKFPAPHTWNRLVELPIHKKNLIRRIRHHWPGFLKSPSR